MAMLRSEKEALLGVGFVIIILFLLAGLLFGLVRSGENSRRDIEQQYRVKTTLFITQHHLDLRSSDIHCIIGDPNAFNWCSYPLNGHTAWAICNVEYGCFTNY